MKLLRFEKVYDWVRLQVELSSQERTLISYIAGSDPCHRGVVDLSLLTSLLGISTILGVVVREQKDSGCVVYMFEKPLNWEVNYRSLCSRRGIRDDDACAGILVAVMSDFLELMYRHMPVTIGLGADTSTSSQASQRR